MKIRSSCCWFVFLFGFFLPAIGVSAFSWLRNPSFRHGTTSASTSTRQPSRNPRFETAVKSSAIEPPLLLDENGREITTPTERRERLIELFLKNVYGRAPKTPYQISFDHQIITQDAFHGLATLFQVTISIQTQKGSLSWEVPLLIPNDTGGPNDPDNNKKVPLFLLICNTCRPGPRVDPLQPCPFWPTEEIIKAGFATASFYNGDVDPDDGQDDHGNGIHALLDNTREDDAWGAIGAWAWAVSRFLDYVEKRQSDRIHCHQVAVVGHSRGGKTALWAAAQDERIAMAVSNNSGCTGASLARHRAVGAETIQQINDRFPHWFCRNYRSYNGNVDALPVDQHMLLALMAPRALHVASATHDFWADPTGEFLATCEAAHVWTDVYGEETESGFVSTSIPKANSPKRTASSKVAYHMRMGEHDLCLYDWHQYMDTAKKVLG